MCSKNAIVRIRARVLADFIVAIASLLLKSIDPAALSNDNAGLAGRMSTAYRRPAIPHNNLRNGSGRTALA